MNKPKILAKLKKDVVKNYSDRLNKFAIENLLELFYSHLKEVVIAEKKEQRKQMEAEKQSLIDLEYSTIIEKSKLIKIKRRIERKIRMTQVDYELVEKFQRGLLKLEKGSEIINEVALDFEQIKIEEDENISESK